MLEHQGSGWFPSALVGPLCGAVAATTVLSAIAYLMAWWPRLRRWEE